MDAGSVQYTNSGTVTLSGGNLTVNQSGAGASFTNTGTISLTAGRTFTSNSGTFNQQAGSLTGPGTLAFSNSTANFTADFNNTETILLLFGAALNGPGTITNAA